MKTHSMCIIFQNELLIFVCIYVQSSQVPNQNHTSYSCEHSVHA